MELTSILDVLERLAPLHYAESWDNTGLLIGDRAAEVTKILVTVDYTDAVAEEAAAQGADLVVAYHPPLFSAIKRIPARAPWVDAIRRDIALYSMHTALDVAEGGTNDGLADACGVAREGRAPLRPFAAKDAECKLVTFVPADKVAALSDALFDAGAGRIGDYAKCSFRLTGTGTFFGGEGTNPEVGEKGRLETVDEVRLETVVPLAKLAQVTAALRRAHPYEEPAFDLVRLAAPPATVGQGRVGVVSAPDRRAIVDRLKQALGLAHVLVAGPLDAPVRRVAVAAGAGGELGESAVHARADMFVTGELRHHDALSLARRGVTCVATLHSNSERAAVRAFGARLGSALAELDEAAVPVVTSAADRDPFEIV